MHFYSGLLAEEKTAIVFKILPTQWDSKRRFNRLSLATHLKATSKAQKWCRKARRRVQAPPKGTRLKLWQKNQQLPAAFLTLMVQHDVFWLEISINDAFLVQVPQRHRNFSQVEAARQRGLRESDAETFVVHKHCQPNHGLLSHHLEPKSRFIFSNPPGQPSLVPIFTVLPAK